MAVKGLDAGKAFLQGVLSKITDPGQRTAAETLLASDVFVTEVGSGVLGQSEIDRQLQDLRTKTTDLETKTQELDDRDAALTKWQGDLTDWRTQNQATLDLGVKAKTAGWKMGDPIPQGDPAKKTPEGTVTGLTKEELEATLAGERASFLGFAAEQNQLMRDHFQAFGEILDVVPLIKHPDVGKVGLLGVYQLVHKDALATKATERTQKAEEVIRADERAKVLAAHGNQMPYPLAGSQGSGSPLDGLPAKLDANAPPVSVVDKAVAEFQRLQQSAGR